LPENLIKLTFSGSFNQSVDNLPKSLTDLIFEEYSQYDLPLDNLPKNINKITLNCNHKLINILPQHIEILHIKFSYCDKYNKKIDNLPISLKKIIINCSEFQKYLPKINFGTNIIIALPEPELEFPY
jgi:hypothetical protein